MIKSLHEENREGIKFCQVGNESFNLMLNGRLIEHDFTYYRVEWNTSRVSKILMSSFSLLKQLNNDQVIEIKKIIDFYIEAGMSVKIEEDICVLPDYESFFSMEDIESGEWLKNPIDPLPGLDVNFKSNPEKPFFVMINEGEYREYLHDTFSSNFSELELLKIGWARFIYDGELNVFKLHEFYAVLTIMKVYQYRTMMISSGGEIEWFSVDILLDAFEILVLAERAKSEKEVIDKQAIVDKSKNQKVKAGLAKAERFKPFKKFVFEEFFKSDWKNPRQAATRIEKLLREKIASSQLPKGVMQGEGTALFDTVYKWTLRIKKDKPDFIKSIS